MYILERDGYICECIMYFPPTIDRQRERERESRVHQLIHPVCGVCVSVCVCVVCACVCLSVCVLTTPHRKTERVCVCPNQMISLLLLLTDGWKTSLNCVLCVRHRAG